MCCPGVSCWPQTIVFVIACKMGWRRLFHTARLPAEKRIGPHNQDVISVLVGNLLGDGHGEKRKNATRFHIHMSSRNAEYVFWLHNFFAERGYASLKKPSVAKQIGKGNSVYLSIKWRTFSFRSLNSLYDAFYVERGAGERGWRKRVPPNIGSLLTEKSLSIWVMDDGGRSGSGMKISTESFSLSDTLLLQRALRDKWSLEPTVQRHAGSYLLYFRKSDLPRLDALVRPHFLPSMLYKLETGKKQS